jgi:hypothetical protein
MKSRSYFAIFVYVVAANIPFWMASQSMGFLFTGLFNVEFVMIGVLSFFLRHRAVPVCLALIAILLDMVRGVNSTYMLSASEMVGSARYLFEFAPSHLWAVAMVAICTVMVCFMVALAAGGCVDGRERGCAVSVLGIFAILCVGIDVGTGHIRVLRPDRILGSVGLTRSPARSLIWWEIRERGFREAASVARRASAMAASTQMPGFAATPASLPTNAVLPNVVLILVESWGKPFAGQLEESLLRPYSNSDITAKYTLSRGTVPFHGPTVAGEARELCGSAMGFGLLNAPASELNDCLPAKMKGMGYQSIGVHGFSAGMFNRGELYRNLGFDESWFRDRLQAEGLSVCPGPFPGVCDAAVSTWIGDRLQRSSDSPQFIYWVTLNSHLPVPVPNRVKAPPSCSEVSTVAHDSALCSWYQLVFNVHRSVSELALRSTARPTIFLIVGDHAPPFSSAELRGQFSDQVVPYVLLVPKKDELRKDWMAVRSLAATTGSPTGMRKPHAKNRKIPSFAAVGG